MNFIRIGKVNGAFGLNGVLKVKPITENIELLVRAEFLLLSNCLEPQKSLRVTNVQLHGECLLFTCAGIDDVAKVKALNGFNVLASAESIPSVGNDEVYWYKIDGSSVVDVDGVEVGKLVDYLETGSNDVFRIELLDGTYAMISNNKDHVLDIKVEDKVIVIDRIGLVSEDV